MDPDARPSKKDMKLWVDVIRFVKRGARGGAFGFFTYMELSTVSHRLYVANADELSDSYMALVVPFVPTRSD